MAEALATARQRKRLPLAAESDYEAWVKFMFPAYVSKPFATRHRNLLDWAWTLDALNRPRPYIGIWPRGGGKSTLAEIVAVMLGALNKRKYIVYVRRTQPKADESVANIAALLESKAIEQYYPMMGQRSIGKFGNARDWRRNRLRTASGYVVDGLGMDGAFRSAKMDMNRPDCFIFDDIDDPFDSEATVQKIIDTITMSILPAGNGRNLAILGIQNLIRNDGFFGRMVNNKADYLADRVVDGPHPALNGFKYEQQADEEGRLKWKITQGEPTWEGQNKDTCQDQITLWGLLPFRKEAQHEVGIVKGGMYDGLKFQHVHPNFVPTLTAIEVWLDPAVTSNKKSNCQGIIVDGIDIKKDLYRLYAWESILPPDKTIEKAILLALKYGARAIGIETDQGGDVWGLTYNRLFEEMRKNALDKAEEIFKATGEKVKIVDGFPLDAKRPQFKAARAGSVGGKLERQGMMRSDYDGGHIFHVEGTHEILESALQRFPLVEPFDLADAAFWGWYHLRHRGSWTR